MALAGRRKKIKAKRKFYNMCILLPGNFHSVSFFLKVYFIDHNSFKSMLMLTMAIMCKYRETGIVIT